MQTADWLADQGTMQAAAAAVAHLLREKLRGLPPFLLARDGSLARIQALPRSQLVQVCYIHGVWLQHCNTLMTSMFASTSPPCCDESV